MYRVCMIDHDATLKKELKHDTLVRIEGHLLGFKLSQEINRL